MVAIVEKESHKPKTDVGRAEPLPVFRSRGERIAAGKTLRENAPRSSHAGWKPPTKRRDPIDILEESNKDRLPELVPIRYGRMLASPFTFLRGSAALMASRSCHHPKHGTSGASLRRLPLAQFWLIRDPRT